MSEAPTLRDYLYRTLEAQILTGQLKYGDSLPSWSELCTLYRVGLRTVKETMCALRKNGYITTEKRKNAVVAYRGITQTGSVDTTAHLEELLKRKNSIVQTFAASITLVTDLVVKGAALFDAADCAVLCKTREKLTFCPLRESYGLFCTVLELCVSKLKNPLASELIIELKSYMELPRIPGYDAYFSAWRVDAGQHLDNIFRALESNTLENLAHPLTELLRMSANMAEVVLEQVSASCKEAPEESTPFHWEAEKGRFCRYSWIARDLMEQICRGNPPDGGFLPSIATLSESYSVSPVTVRRALALLHTIGIAKSINGKGTKILLQPDGNCWVGELDSTLRDDLMLFLWALQNIVITCKNMLLSAFPFLPAQYAETLEHAVTQPQQGLVMGMVLLPIIPAIPNPTLRQIYQQLTCVLQRGRCLAFAPLHTLVSDDLNEKYAALMNGLHLNNAAVFADDFYDLFSYLLTIARRMVFDLGAYEARDLVLP